jgi:TetR/AcrR family transcriptional repressor of nem operon
LVRISREKVAENRGKVLNSAASLFREKGFDGISLVDLMRSAGLTHGGFYNHFASKDELEVEACRHIFEVALSRLEPIGRIEDPLQRKAARDAYFGRYLSPDFCDKPFHTCPMVSFGADICRKAPAVQEAYAEGLSRYVRAMERAYGLPDDASISARSLVLAEISKLVGAASLARSCAKSDPELSKDILASALSDLTTTPDLAARDLA